ncbi:hypothetical protein D3C85_1604080 [compost metagenome]
MESRVFGQILTNDVAGHEKVPDVLNNNNQRHGDNGNNRRHIPVRGCYGWEGNPIRFSNCARIYSS